MIRRNLPSNMRLEAAELAAQQLQSKQAPVVPTSNLRQRAPANGSIAIPQGARARSGPIGPQPGLRPQQPQGPMGTSGVPGAQPAQPRPPMSPQAAPRAPQPLPPQAPGQLPPQTQDRPPQVTQPAIAGTATSSAPMQRAARDRFGYSPEDLGNLSNDVVGGWLEASSDTSAQEAAARAEIERRAEIDRMNAAARMGAAGFGLSGANMALQQDIRNKALLDAQRAMFDIRSEAADDAFARQQAGVEAAATAEEAARQAEYDALINQLIQQMVDEGNAPPAPESAFDRFGNRVAESAGGYANTALDNWIKALRMFGIPLPEV